MAAIDTDVLHKATVYGVMRELLAAIPNRAEQHCILTAAKYVIRNKLVKNPPNKGTDIAINYLNKLLDELLLIEPTGEEISLAATLEYKAQLLNLEFDSGESLLSAVLFHRTLTYMLTGDKRAIAAAEIIFPEVFEIEKLKGKFMCLEQSIYWLLIKSDPAYVRSCICNEPSIDTTLSTCFSCNSPEVPIESWNEGLQSYIEDIRVRAPTMLYNTNS